MRKITLKLSNIFLSIFSVLLATLSLGAFVLALVGKSIPSFDFIDFVYLIYGFTFVPMEYFITGTVGRMLADPFSILTFCVSVSVFVYAITLMVYKLKSNKENEYRKKYYKVFSYVLLILLLMVLVFNLCMLFINFDKINNFLLPIVEMLSKNNNGDILIIIYISITIYAIATILFSILATLFYKKSAPKTVKIYGTINFYSDEFEEPKNETIVKQEEEVKQVEFAGIKESSEEAKDLIAKIMQLDELRKSGQINDVEYTKLRQKAIKRYK